RERGECVRQSLHGVRARVVRRVSKPRQVNSDASSAKLREALKGRLPIGRRLAISVNTDNRRWATFPFDGVHCVLDQAWSSARLLQLLCLLGGSLQGLERFRLPQEGVLNLCLREPIPFVVPGRLNVLSCLGTRVLLSSDFGIVSGLLLRSDDVWIPVHGLERIANAILQVPILGRVVFALGVLAAHVVDKAPGSVLHLCSRTDAIEAVPAPPPPAALPP